MKFRQKRMFIQKAIYLSKNFPFKYFTYYGKNLNCSIIFAFTLILRFVNWYNSS